MLQFLILLRIRLIALTEAQHALQHLFLPIISARIMLQNVNYINNKNTG